MNLTVQRVILSGVISLAAIGCVAPAINPEPSVDTTSPWLQRCDDDSQCGQLSCLCGICSSLCDTAADCRAASKRAHAICTSVPSNIGHCADLASEQTLCIPDCSRGACGSDPGGSAEHPSGVIPPAQRDPVPRCPELAQPGGFPRLLFTTEVDSYEGTATVTQLVPTQFGTSVLLVPTDVADEHFDLRFSSQPPSYLAPGQRVQVLVRSGGSGSGKYTLIVVRDEAGKILIAYHNGSDELYSSGMFKTRDTLGVSLALRMICESPVGVGCFKDQVQAQYEGLIGADSPLVMSGPLTSTPLQIDGTSYTASFDSSSVDGSERLPSCSAGIMPARYLTFMMIRD